MLKPTQLYRVTFQRYLRTKQEYERVQYHGMGIPFGIVVTGIAPIAALITTQPKYIVAFAAGLGYVSYTYHLEMKADNEKKVCQEIMTMVDEKDQSELKDWAMWAEHSQTKEL
jgi:hypothetical protein